ncbi:HNH endonuclease [Agrococcus baldri]|uniref:HNH endonuclease n=1 Tax=Agrococcus baldri TaxID=153730 RepID=A0AA94KZF0_9MICO|nr:HNH endonuclease signature motif containing protein [Agrococcus baldri]SFS08701.1 HNH endonuclease [Agrococcus baldri]
MEIFGPLLAGFAPVVGPQLWWLIPVVVAALVLRFPMLGRGPNSSRRDPWRGFKFGARAAVLERAGGRCEGSAFLFWGRCDDPAVEVDHVMPWSRGGPTVVGNGQALCRAHNRLKGAWTPAWWYVLGLERRRRSYFPVGADVRVLAVMSGADRMLRERSAAKRV